MGTAIEQRTAISISDLNTSPKWPLRDAAVAAGIRSVLIVPLIRSERVFGALVLMRRVG